MSRYHVNLHLSTEQLESFYAGSVRDVSAVDIKGRRIQFPLSALRPFVSHVGVSGFFELQVTTDHRLRSIRRIDH